MFRHRLRGHSMRSRAKFRGGAAASRRRQWLLEDLEGRLLLSATIYTVTDTSDSASDTGSLRYAIDQANANTNLDGSMIEFNPADFPANTDEPELIALSSTLELSEKGGPEMIDGPATGPVQVVIGDNPDIQVFSVDAGVTAVFQGLEITPSYNPFGNSYTADLGGILNEGNATVTNCEIESNGGPSIQGGDIFNFGATSVMTITGSTISGSADFNNPATAVDTGGIANAGTMTITSSTISANAFDFGGGIENLGSGTLVVADSTINGNMALEDGGGIYNAGTATVVNCTIAKNSAGNNAQLDGNGGGIANEPEFPTGGLTVVNNTIADNSAGGLGGSGGGLYVQGGSATLDNTIIAQNGPTASPDDIAGTVAAASAYNLIGTGGSGGLTGGTNGNQVGIAGPGLDPNGLAPNGGPTRTIALEVGSPAIGAGSTALAVDPSTGLPLATDQRGAGYPRIVNGTVDIGAFEYGTASGYALDLATVLGTGSGNAGDLLYCIEQANANDNPSGSVIQFDPSVFNTTTPQTIILTIPLDLTAQAGPVVIEGPGAAALTISGNHSNSVLEVDDGTTAILSALTISDAGGVNGAIENTGTLTMTDCTISGNTGTNGYAGGIFNLGTLTATDCTISGNSTNGVGGGIQTTGDGTLTLNGCTISGNSGGGIDAYGGTLKVTNCTISDNSINGQGGGINLVSGGPVGPTLMLVGSTIDGNSAGQGGGIDVYDNNGGPATVTVISSTIDGNSAGQGGGICWQDPGTLTITGSTIADNSATFVAQYGNGGGGIYLDGAATAIVNTTIAGNSASLHGGGIDYGVYFGNSDEFGASSLTVVNSTIADNNVSPGTTAGGVGGGLYVAQDYPATLNNTIVVQNTATGASGGENPTTADDITSAGSVSGSYNLIGTVSGSVGLNNETGGNQVGATLDVNSGLDPGGLAFNGGPTQTIALEPGSPAIAAGSPALAVDASGKPLTIDQRGSGYARIVNGKVDIGALEVVSAGSSNPAPIVTSISPEEIAAGNASPLTLTVIGSGFVIQSVVDWNAVALATTYVSSKELTATIPASDFASFGTALVTVSSPTPGGGVSSSETFQVLKPAPPTPELITGILPVFLHKTHKKGKAISKPALTGFTIDFSTPLNPANASNPANYQIDTVTTEKVKKTIKRILHPIKNFTVSYVPGSLAVAVELGSTQKFPTGGQITVLADANSAVGGALAGTTEFAVSKGGTSIEPE